MRRERKSVDLSLSLESYMTYALGTGPGGRTLSHLICSNDRAQNGRCQNVAQMACAQCGLVKYCSGHCQRQHWAKHRSDCESKLNQCTWQPNWVLEGRQPSFHCEGIAIQACDMKPNPSGLWGRIPGYDILRPSLNEGLAVSVYQNFKLCFAGANDIRNLMQTVNSLPNGYQGQCDILINDPDAVSANQSLVILYILLTDGPSIDEVAELALHLMYSSRLTEAGSAYVRRCVHMIYGDSARQSDMTFQRCFPTRGRGKLFSAQPSMAIKRPLEAFLSRYELPKAMRRMRDVLLDPSRVDDRHKILANLEPAHRLAHVYYWKTGVLAPFSLDLRPFTHPNRLAFSPLGSWLGKTDDISPLQSWNVSQAQATGLRHGVDSSGDIFGCLFFHIKQELREFIIRMKNFHVNIHHTQYDSRLLSKGISVGVLPSFVNASFDRIDLGGMADSGGSTGGGRATSLEDCLRDWVPLINRENPRSCLMMSFSKWSNEREAMKRDPLSSPEKVLEMLKRRCRNIPSLGPRLKKLLEQGMHSPSMIRLTQSLDAFIDTGPAFQEFLNSHDALGLGEGLGIRQRRRNRIHPKRFGVSMDAPPGQALPNLSKEEYYSLFTVGRADLLTRFVEFEPI
ncbi:hypothetical protein FA15DRAFT_670717 [Coprinopsis marcescibilis]|uniref:MYND-type domain-containing protein n=1 Tax=Coprinopsis marcescibilis TaxID=230819 RepID=A0A5C3KRI0_COPMA|nr:hypothetical protein FA15DRAFT_670717 [Coprinopsis marcescibilis]